MYSVFNSLTAHAMKSPDRAAIRTLNGRTVSYRELLAAVDFLTDIIPESARTIALTGQPSATWIATDLAVTLLGRRLVPVPFFFSPEQIQHVVKDAGADMIINVCASDADLRVDGIRNVVHICDDIAFSAFGRHPLLPSYKGGAERIIYTSGTTGRPKGVRHGDRQLSHAISGIAEVAQARPSDRHLCLLPPALLLEQIAGQFVPIVTGAEIDFAGDAIMASLTGDGRVLAEALDASNPTTTILVPRQLEALLTYAESRNWRPPVSLRLVAVGGAPVSAPVLDTARRIGLPVRFGYGLSECCSVVSLEVGPSALTAPGEVPPSGRPLPNTEVWIEDGQIMVRSPGVMTGYLGRDDIPDRVWRTGDVGRIDPDGRITVFGRLDRLMILPNGRNVSPEWIESLTLSADWIVNARASLNEKRAICITLQVATDMVNVVSDKTDIMLADDLHALFDGLPDYALPEQACLNIAGQSLRTIPLSRETDSVPEKATT